MLYAAVAQFQEMGVNHRVLLLKQCKFVQGSTAKKKGGWHKGPRNCHGTTH